MYIKPTAYNHQQDVRTGQKKFINLKPWFSPKYALSRVTFFGSLAALSLGLMYIYQQYAGS